jgi:tRNA-dihydrouridine synthase
MVVMTAEIVKRAHVPVTVKTRLGWDEDSINIMDVANESRILVSLRCQFMAVPGAKCIRAKRVGFPLMR